MSRVIAAWHEAGHAIVSRALRQPIESVTVSPIGTGVLRAAPLPADASDEEIARRLTIVLAGKEGSVVPLTQLQSKTVGNHGSQLPISKRSLPKMTSKRCRATRTCSRTTRNG